MQQMAQIHIILGVSWQYMERNLDSWSSEKFRSLVRFSSAENVFPYRNLPPVERGVWLQRNRSAVCLKMVQKVLIWLNGHRWCADHTGRTNTKDGCECSKSGGRDLGKGQITVACLSLHWCGTLELYTTLCVGKWDPTNYVNAGHQYVSRKSTKILVPCIVIQWCNVNQQNTHSFKVMFKFNSSCLLLFRTSCVHHLEELIVHAVLYGMLLMLKLQ